VTTNSQVRKYVTQRVGRPWEETEEEEKKEEEEEEKEERRLLLVSQILHGSKR
jgi:hypothetical protein